MALALLVLAACGDDAVSGDAVPNDSDPATVTVGQAGLLRAEDMLPGWRQRPGPGDAGPDSVVESCEAVDDQVVVPGTGVVTLGSPTFEAGTSLAHNTVTVAPGDVTTEMFDVLESSPECFRARIDAHLDDAPEVLFGGDPATGTPRIQRATYPDFGDRSIAYRLSAPIASEDETLTAGLAGTMFVDVVVVQLRDDLVAYEFIGFEAPVGFDAAATPILRSLGRVALAADERPGGG